jgi:hypothetical protein
MKKMEKDFILISYFEPQKKVLLPNFFVVALLVMDNECAPSSEYFKS